MKVYVETTPEALERLCDAQALLRAQVQVLFGFTPSRLDGPTIEAIVDAALDLGLTVELNEKAQIVTISA